VEEDRSLSTGKLGLILRRKRLRESAGCKKMGRFYIAGTKGGWVFAGSRPSLEAGFSSLEKKNSRTQGKELGRVKDGTC